MKIALIINHFAGIAGGMERVLADVANALCDAHEIFVLTFDAPKAKIFYPLDDRVRLISMLPKQGEAGYASAKFKRRLRKLLPNWGMFQQTRWDLSHGVNADRIEQALRQFGIDLAVAFAPPAMTPTALAAERLGIAAIASTHNTPWQDFDNPKRWDSSPVDRKLRVECLSKFTSITVLVPEFKDWYASHLQDRLVVMPNMVAPAVFPDPLPPRRKVICAMSRLTPIKQNDFLIRAWDSLRHDFPDWSVEIYGDGSEHAKLQALIDQLDLGQSVRLMGRVSDVASVYLTSAILCHPAQFEGFGLSVGEALNHRLPVVAYADCQGVNTLVVDGVNGLLVSASPDRISTLADGLRRLMADDGLRQSLAENGPASMMNYRPDEVRAKWLELIASVKRP